MVHPQKRHLLRKLLDSTIGRILELKHELVNLDNLEYRYDNHLTFSKPIFHLGHSSPFKGHASSFWASRKALLRLSAILLRIFKVFSDFHRYTKKLNLNVEIEITYFLETSYHDSTMAQIGMTPNEVELTIPSYVTSGMLTINISKNIRDSFPWGPGIGKISQPRYDVQHKRYHTFEMV